MRVDWPYRHASDRCQVGHRPAAPALLFNETRRNSACHCGNPASGTVPLRGPDHSGRGRNARLLPAELGGLVWVPHPFCRVASRRRSRALLRTAGTLRPDRQRCEGSRDARPVERAAQVREIVGERGRTTRSANSSHRHDQRPVPDRGGPDDEVRYRGRIVRQGQAGRRTLHHGPHAELQHQQGPRRVRPEHSRRCCRTQVPRPAHARKLREAKLLQFAKRAANRSPKPTRPC